MSARSSPRQLVGLVQARSIQALGAGLGPTESSDPPSYGKILSTSKQMLMQLV